MSTETNGFFFAFPEVVRAYKTSIHRKLSSSVLGTILGGGLPIAVGAGIGVYLLHVVLKHILNYMSSMGSCYGIAGVIIYPLIVAGGGYLVGNFVGKSAIKAKFPDANSVAKLALGIGLIGYLAYLTMYMMFSYAPERFDHWMDYLREAFYLTLFVGSAVGLASSKVQETPFCENCSDFMIPEDIGEYDTMGAGNALEIAQETALLAILESRQFAKLNDLNDNWATGNYCVIRIWHCPVCNKNGFVDCATVKSRTSTNNNGQVNREGAHRLVHSSHIDGDEIQILMQAKRALGTPKLATANA